MDLRKILDLRRKGKSVLEPCSESKENPKKQKKLKGKSEWQEIKELSKSIRELTEAIKKLPEILLTKADRHEEILLTKADLQLKEKETPEKKPDCCFDCEEALGNNHNTIFVNGFEYLRPRDELKKLLSNFFSSCGKVTRVFVPIECRTRCPLGFAFIDFETGQGNEKALEFNGALLQGSQLEVTIARKRGEYYGYTNFRGCDRCKYGGEVPRWKEDDRSGYRRYIIPKGLGG